MYLRKLLILLILCMPFAYAGERGGSAKPSGESFNMTNERITTNETSDSTNIIRWHHQGDKDYTSANEIAGVNSNVLYADISGEYNWGLHVNLAGGANGSRGVAIGAHAIDSTGQIIDVSADGTIGLSLYQSNLTAAADGDQNIVEIHGATDWQDHTYVGKDFLGDVFDYKLKGVQRYRLNYEGRSYHYHSDGTSNLTFYHDGSNGVFASSAGGMGLQAANGTTNFISTGTNANSCYLDVESFAAYYVWQAVSAGDVFYTVPRHIFAAGINIGADSTNNLIDDAENGSGFNYLHIGTSRIEVHAGGTIAADDVTPSMSNGTHFTTSANTGATAITDLDDPVVGETYYIIGGSNTNSSTFADSGNFNLSASWTASLDDVLILYVQADNDYIELGRVNN